MILKPFFPITVGTVITIIIISTFVSCGGCKNKKTGDDTIKAYVNVNVPDFIADSAYSFVEKQLVFGPRALGTTAHEKCADYLTSKFKTYTKNVIVQETKVKTFDGKIFPIKNIIASFSPEINNRIFICAHWDSRSFADNDPDVKKHKTPIPGANDGASGVGVIMELARLLNINKPPIGIDLILFDAEDYGQPQKSDFPEQEDTWCLGSQYWAKNPHKKGYFAKYGILLDMVGAKEATFTMDGTSMPSLLQ